MFRRMRAFVVSVNVAAVFTARNREEDVIASYISRGWIGRLVFHYSRACRDDKPIPSCGDHHLKKMPKLI